MTHRKIYDELKECAKKHKELGFLLGQKEQKKYGFEFAETDSDKIIDTLNYGIDDYSFDSYNNEMLFYKKSFSKRGDFKENGIYENHKPNKNL